MFTNEDLDIISWDRIDGFVEKIYNDVIAYLNSNDLKIRYIVPIMRGGGVPGVMLSHMFGVVDMLPVQLKYNHDTNKVDKKIGLEYVRNIRINSNECVLLVEGNHVTGTTSNMAANLLREKFGNDVKIIYVSLTRDYMHKDSVENVCYTTWARSTNETRELNEDECNKLGISYNLVSVYPWENVKEELEELNG